MRVTSQLLCLSRRLPLHKSLSTLQDDLQHYILGVHQHALSEVISTTTLPAERRLDIYFNAYLIRLVELLQDTFERVPIYIGDDSFQSAARAYIEKSPSISRSLRDYGATFPAFVRDYFPHDQEVAELAQMDLTLRYAFDAEDAEILSLAALGNIAPDEWDSLVFKLHPSFSLHRFDFKTVAIWQAMNDGIAPPAAVRAEPSDWLFWRKGLQPHFRSLSQLELVALQGISQQQTFGEICQQLAESTNEDVTLIIGSWLRLWIEDGLLIDELISP